MAGGLCTLTVVALWTRLFPELRRIDRLSQISPIDAGSRGYS